MKVLVVEDIGSDAILLREALRDVGIDDEDLVYANDGAAALAVLEADGPLPQLVLLDLNLPGISGHEVLERVRADPRLAQLPVVVLTTSGSPKDVAYAYSHRANAYVRKPNGFEPLRAVATAIRDFWLRTATLPSPYMARG